MWKYSWWDRIIKLAETMTGEELIKKLREDAVTNTGQRLMDDFTIILIEG